jgi:hypothetical protein
MILLMVLTIRISFHKHLFLFHDFERKLEIKRCKFYSDNFNRNVNILL